MTFDDLLDALRASLGGKDPRKTKSKTEGQVLVLLRDDAGELHRATIRIDAASVSIEPHADEMVGEGWAVLRGRLDDAARYLVGADLEPISRLEVYGETSLFGMIREVAAVKRDLLGVRLG